MLLRVRSKGATEGRAIPVVDESIVIDRPRDDVFAFYTDPDKVPLWASGTIEYERTTEGPMREGTQSRAKSKVVG